jgi:uncharacterized protein
MNGRFPPSQPFVLRRLFARGWILLLGLLLLVLFSGSAIAYYVDALWFESLGYGDVFWTTVRLQSTIFLVFGALTFGIVYGSFLALKPAQAGAFPLGTIIVSGRAVRLPVEPVFRLVGLVGAIVIALGTAAGMASEWPTLALWWHTPRAIGTIAAGAVDPVFGRPVAFYLLTLPAWELVAGWLTTMAVIACVAGVVWIAATGVLVARSGRGRGPGPAGPGLAMAWAVLLLMMAVRTWLGRYDRLLEDHALFSGVTYTDAHVALPGALVSAAAFVLGAAISLAAAASRSRTRWLVGSVVPPLVCALGTGVIGWYVTSFIVRPNQLVREQPYLTNNIVMTRQAYGLDRIRRVEFPAEPGLAALDGPRNQATLQNIRLWDWRALQDTLRQIQEIRTYYDFPDIDIDRYRIGGETRHVMLAARELNVSRLPANSRTWVNERLVYTHGYGVTMNAVNGFTAEGLPELLLRNMPVESAVPELRITRPEIYFGELTTTDVYVKTRQKEFNYPQGQTNELTSYEGSGGIVLGGLLRRILIAIDRGDLGKLPFSDDITASSRLLMRRDVRSRVAALAPFLVFDSDPYIVVGADGRLSWILDGYTVSDRYPGSRSTRFEDRDVNYVRNSVKAVVDAYEGTTTFYVFDAEDPIIAAWRRVFPALFRDQSSMPADLRAHVRYPELLLSVQGDVFGVYHMTDAAMFYNREDLWTVASQPGPVERGQAPKPQEPNFVLMSLPGGPSAEFIGILPFTPANRNNLIGWIAGRSDAPSYGDAVVYDFPRTRLVDGPLQIEARIDQDPQLSGQLSLWNQQGSRVRRGSLLVIPIGRGLLYAEPIYLQAERSPMPELRLVVLALQDRLVHGPTFEAALAKLFGGAAPVSERATAAQPAAPPAQPGGAPDVDALIAQAGQQMADYQRLTAEGKLGEAGQMLERLKKTLDELNKRRR